MFREKNRHERSGDVPQGSSIDVAVAKCGPDPCALAWARLNDEVPPATTGSFQEQRQTQPDMPCRASGTKGIPNPLDQLLAHPPSIIRNLNHHPVLFQVFFNPYFDSRRTCLHGIFKEIQYV